MYIQSPEIQDYVQVNIAVKQIGEDGNCKTSRHLASWGSQTYQKGFVKGYVEVDQSNDP